MSAFSFSLSLCYRRVGNLSHCHNGWQAANRSFDNARIVRAGVTIDNPAAQAAEGTLHLFHFNAKWCIIVNYVCNYNIGYYIYKTQIRRFDMISRQPLQFCKISSHKTHLQRQVNIWFPIRMQLKKQHQSYIQINRF